METKFKQLDTELEDKDTVLSFISPVAMFKIGELFLAIKTAFQRDNMGTLANTLQSRGQVPYSWNNWTKQGIDCEILKPTSGGWKKGKVRLKLTLEFCPDEPDIIETPSTNQSLSPLDDIRKTMNGVS